MAGVRGAFPFLDVQIAGKDIAYLDNPASTQKPRVVLDRMVAFMSSEYANVHRGMHGLAERATAGYEGSRVRARRFFGVPDDLGDVVFTTGTTGAINLVARGWGDAQVRAGDSILLTELEHHSNLVPWLELARRTGASVEYVPVLRDGSGFDLAAAERMLASGPKVFAFAHLSNTLALTAPAREWCDLARRHGTTTVVDAAQTAGHMEIDFGGLGCDFLACSGHKMCGPTGVGVLCGRSEALESMRPCAFGGEMVGSVTFESAEFRSPPARFEAGTPPIVEAVGLHAAMDFLDGIGLDAIWQHSCALASEAAERLRAMDRVRVFGPEDGRGHLVTFAVDGVHAHDLAFFCDSRGVAIRAGYHCAEPLMRKLGAQATARAGFYLYNIPEDVDRLVDAVHGAIRFFLR